MKNRFTVTIETDNAAFSDDPYREIARILHVLSVKVETEEAVPRFLYDLNGNKVGETDFYESS